MKERQLVTIVNTRFFRPSKKENERGRRST